MRFKLKKKKASTENIPEKYMSLLLACLSLYPTLWLAVADLQAPPLAKPAYCLPTLFSVVASSIFPV